MLSCSNELVDVQIPCGTTYITFYLTRNSERDEEGKIARP
jgi:hypothetical protein